MISTHIVKHLRALFLLACICSVCGVPALAQPKPALIEDKEFSLDDWQLIFDNSQGYSANATQETSGGAEGAFRRVITSRPAGLDPIPDIHIFTRESYDPSNQGAIDGISYSDRHSWFGGERQHKLVLRQSGTIFSASGYVITMASGLWRGVQAQCLKATDFQDDEGNNPDFSATGGVIEFGYLRQEIGSLAFEQGSDTGIDNFRYVVFPAPNADCVGEPPRLAMTKTDNNHEWSTDPVIPYLITITNQGDQAATDLVITETVPEQTTFRPDLSDTPWSCTPNNNAGSSCSISIPELSGDNFQQFPFFVEVLSGTPPAWEVYNEVALSSPLTQQLRNEDSLTTTLIRCYISSYSAARGDCSSALEDARDEGFDTDNFATSWEGCCLARFFLSFQEGACIPISSGSFSRRNQTANATLLHQLRDQVLQQTPGGRRLVTLFYQHSISVAEAGVKDPAVVQQARDTYDAWLPLIEAAVTGTPSTITAEQVNALNSFFDKVEQNTNPEFAEILREERERVDLSGLLGGSTSEILSSLDSLSCSDDENISSALCVIDQLQGDTEDASINGRRGKRLRRFLANAEKQMLRAEAASKRKRVRKRLRSANRFLQRFRKLLRKISVGSEFTTASRNDLRSNSRALIQRLRRLRR